MSHQSATTDPRIFYGWFVVAGAFAVTFVGFGCAYTFSAFVGSLQRDFAASRGSVSLVFSLAGFLYFGLGIVSGPLADRWGSRRLAVAGMLLTAIGLVMASMARSLVEVYAAYGLGVGLGVGCAYVPAIGALQRWFVRRRGFASGLAVSGIGIGTLAMPPFASVLIDALGWRSTYFVLGCLAAIVGGGLALLIENDPRDRGLGPDGDPVQPDAASVRREGASVSEAVRSRRFAGLYAACLIGSFGVFVPFVHLVPYALDHGIAQSSAVLLLGVIGVGSTAGRFFLGGMADRMGRQTRNPHHVCRDGVVTGGLGILDPVCATRCLRICLRRVLRRLGRGPACAGHGLFRRTQCQRHHRYSIYQRGFRHPDRPQRRGIHLRSQPQLYAADIGQRLLRTPSPRSSWWRCRGLRASATASAAAPRDRHPPGPPGAAVARAGMTRAGVRSVAAAGLRPARADRQDRPGRACAWRPGPAAAAAPTSWAVVARQP